MKKIWVRHVALALTCLQTASCSTPNEARAPASAPVRVTLLGLNDLHGTIEERPVVLGAAPNAKTVKVGGLGVMASYFEIARKENPRTLLLDAGDAYQGTLLSNYFQGRSIVEAYNALGVNASTFGNHEFDYGDAKDKKHGTAADPQGALKKILAAARFPYLSSNVASQSSPQQGKLVGFKNVRPASLFDVHGIKVGVIGATTETTPSQAAPASIKGLVFKKMAQGVLEQAQRLRSSGAQLVVLLAHAGGRCDMSKPAQAGDEACKGDKPDEITALLMELPEGTLDAVMAGHVHAAQAHFIRGVPVVQTIGFGTSFSRIDFWVNPEAEATAPSAKRLAKVEISKPTYFCHQHFTNYASCGAEEAGLPQQFGTPIPATYLGERVQTLEAAAFVLNSFIKKTQELTQKFVVELPLDLTHDRTVESPISNCVADAVKEQMEFETGRKLDLFVSHSGGVRARLPKQVKYGDIFAVLPFDGTMGIAKLTGAELEALGTHQSLSPKSIAVISQGWHVRLLRDPAFPRHRGFVTPAGTPPKAGEYYTILTEDFNVAAGGATDAIMKQARSENRIELTDKLSRDLFEARLKRGNLPASCLGAPLDRTIFVDQ